MTPHERVLELAPKITAIAHRFRRRTKRDVDPRDLEQDAYVALLKRAHRWDGRESFTTFNYLRISGAMIDGLRQWDSRRKGGKPRIYWKPIPERAENIWVSPEPSPLAQILDTELHGMIAELEPRERYIVQRYFFEAIPGSQIARELDMSESRLWQLYRHALETLKGQLQAA